MLDRMISERVFVQKDITLSRFLLEVGVRMDFVYPYIKLCLIVIIFVFVIFLGIARDVGQFLNSGIITAQTELSETTADNDQFLVYDNSAAALRKVQSQYGL